jgi:peptide/nickel transport system ATP-binding protein
VAEPLLSVRDLCVDYVTARGTVRGLDRVSFDVARGEVLGLAGESGSGKSTLAMALMRILPPPAVIAGGEVRFEGRDLLRLSEAELRAVRWSRIAMVFQSAMDALNPVLTVRDQIADTVRAHRPQASGADLGAWCRELVEKVGLAPGVLDAHPHRLSGGMRQRVGIAIALALEPALLILDEPTTALDVIVEREILDEIRGLQRRLGFAVLFITHDLGRMLQVSDRVAVFYAARLVESAPAAELARAPRHPYTQGLLRAFPALDGDEVDLASIPGSPPSLEQPPAGCRFHPRCDRAVDVCRARAPELLTLAPGHSAACHLAT